MKPSSVALFIIALLLFPLIMTHPYYMHLTNLILIYAMTATGLNLVTGYAGQLSLGHAAFFSIGAYSSALLSMKLGWPFPLALVASAVIATVFGALLGIPSLRLRGPYLALATAGFSEIIQIIINNWESLTQGSRGIPEIPPPSLFGGAISSEIAWYYLLIGFFLVCTMASYRIVHSHLGRAFIALRDNEPAASAAGVNPFAHKVLAFAISAFLSGLAGSLYAHYRAYISPDTFTFAESVAFLSMVVVGGKGTLAGPLIGSAALTLVPDLLSFMKDFKMVFHGILLVLCMMFLPGGLESVAGLFRRRQQKDILGKGGPY
ncbi:MAG: branched-chain amino acid ABC transporter permease [Pseudomonadota bacterium]